MCNTHARLLWLPWRRTSASEDGAARQEGLSPYETEKNPCIRRCGRGKKSMAFPPASPSSISGSPSGKRRSGIPCPDNTFPDVAFQGASLPLSRGGEAWWAMRRPYGPSSTLRPPTCAPEDGPEAAAVSFTCGGMSRRLETGGGESPMDGADSSGSST